MNLLSGNAQSTLWSLTIQYTVKLGNSKYMYFEMYRKRKNKFLWSSMCIYF